MHLHRTFELPFSRQRARCHRAANVPDSATMIHLGKQEDKATVSPAMAMPVGDVLSPPVRPVIPTLPRGRGTAQKRWEQLYLAISPAHLLVKDAFCIQPPKAKGSLPSRLTSRVPSCPPPKSRRTRAGVMLRHALMPSAPR